MAGPHCCPTARLAPSKQSSAAHTVHSAQCTVRQHTVTQVRRHTSSGETETRARARPARQGKKHSASFVIVRLQPRRVGRQPARECLSLSLCDWLARRPHTVRPTGPPRRPARGALRPAPSVAAAGFRPAASSASSRAKCVSFVSALAAFLAGPS